MQIKARRLPAFAIAGQSRTRLGAAPGRAWIGGPFGIGETHEANAGSKGDSGTKCRLSSRDNLMYRSSKDAAVSFTAAEELSLNPVLQELSRGLLAERGVATTPVMKCLDVIERRGLKCWDTTVSDPEITLRLATYKTLRRRRMRSLFRPGPPTAPGDCVRRVRLLPA